MDKTPLKILGIHAQRAFKLAERYHRYVQPLRQRREAGAVEGA